MLFRIVAWTLAKHDSRKSTLVEVEGHTSKSFRSRREDEDEWDVSTDRAITVRKYMSEEGVKPDQFHKVTGYGNRRPLQDKLGDLDHAYHNRVSIMVRPRQLVKTWRTQDLPFWQRAGCPTLPAICGAWRIYAGSGQSQAAPAPVRRWICPRKWKILRGQLAETTDSAVSAIEAAVNNAPPSGVAGNC